MINFTWTDSAELFDDDCLVEKITFDNKMDFSEHLFIEGDNYPVLKFLLQKRN